MYAPEVKRNSFYTQGGKPRIKSLYRGNLMHEIMFEPYSSDVGASNNRSSHTMYEGTMITMERYREAVSDEMGLISAKIALSLLKEDREICKKDAGIWKEFMKQSTDYVESKLKYAQGSQKTSLLKIKTVLDAILREEDEVDVDVGLTEIQILDKDTKQTVQQARDDYRKIFRQY